MIGSKVSHYRVDARLGAGGMGVVYRGWDTLVDRPVALKFLRFTQAEDPRSRDRLLREARAAMSVVHENVCPVYGVEELPDGQLCIAMDYCEGLTLGQRMRKGPLAWDECLRIASEIAAGLGAAHAAGVVHRDVKPGNIMLTGEGKVRLLDFGVARRQNTLRTQPGRGAAGTPPYMAPEILSGGSDSFRSDVFSLGVVLWKLLTGVHPFGGKGDPRTLARIVSEDPELTPDVRETMPEELLALLHRLLEKDPDERFADATEVVEPLRAQQRALQGQALAETKRLVPFERPRHPIPLRRLALGLVALALIAFVVWGLPRVGLLSTTPRAGLAVVAPRGPSESMLTEGLATALTWELSKRAEAGVPLWVVPPEWNDEVGAWSERDVTTLLGVGRAVFVEPTSNGGVSLSLQLRGEQAIEIARFDSVPRLEDVMAAIESQGISLGRGAASPDPTRALDYYRGLSHMRRGTAQGDSAVVLLQGALSPGSSAAEVCSLAEALRLRYRAQGQEPDADRSAALIDSLMGTGEIPTRGRVTRGRLALDRGEPEEAERWLRNAELRAPSDFQVLRYLAYAHELQGEFAIAGRIRRETVDQLPDFVGSHERMGLYLYGRGLHEEAWNSFGKALELAPDYAYSYNMLGVCAVELGCWEQAVFMLEHSLQEGRSPHAVANLGIVYYNMAEYEQAVSMLRWTVSEAPENHRSVGALGAALWWSDSRDEAIEHYQRAAQLAEAELTLTPDSAELLLELAGYYALWDTSRARARLEEGAARIPEDSARDYLRAAAVRATLGDVEPALNDLRRAISLGMHPRRVAGSPFLSPLHDTPGYHHLVRPAESPTTACPELPADATL